MFFITHKSIPVDKDQLSSSKIDNFRAKKLLGQNADFRNTLPATVQSPNFKKIRVETLFFIRILYYFSSWKDWKSVEGFLIQANGMMKVVDGLRTGVFLEGC